MYPLLAVIAAESVVHDKKKREADKEEGVKK
jgi:hypothetical protein